MKNIMLLIIFTPLYTSKYLSCANNKDEIKLISLNELALQTTEDLNVLIHNGLEAPAPMVMQTSEVVAIKTSRPGEQENEPTPETPATIHELAEQLSKTADQLENLNLNTHRTEQTSQAVNLALTVIATDEESKKEGDPVTLADLNQSVLEQLTLNPSNPKTIINDLLTEYRKLGKEFGRIADEKKYDREALFSLIQIKHDIEKKLKHFRSNYQFEYQDTVASSDDLYFSDEDESNEWTSKWATIEDIRKNLKQEDETKKAQIIQIISTENNSKYLLENIIQSLTEKKKNQETALEEIKKALQMTNDELNKETKNLKRKNIEIAKLGAAQQNYSERIAAHNDFRKYALLRITEELHEITTEQAELKGQIKKLLGEEQRKEDIEETASELEKLKDKLKKLQEKENEAQLVLENIKFNISYSGSYKVVKGAAGFISYFTGK